MDAVSSNRRRAGRHLARRACTLTLGLCLLVSCGTGSTERETEPSSPASESTKSPTADESPSALPTWPATRDAATLARQLDRAGAVLRGRDAPAADVRKAAEFHQLAVHALASASGAFRREVTGRLHRKTARATRGDVEAARSLRALTSPVPKLPRWRIVAPPPANELLRYYRQAQRRTGVPWTYLAAIHLVETRMGRIRGTSTAGARGPMQFIPSTWELYGRGGDINDPRDAILAAARLLRDNGAPDDMADALHAYNPSNHYVRAVTEHARAMQRSTSTYHGYWHWRVLYRHERGTYVLPVGYPDSPAKRLPTD